jgi:hypothetical protein
MINFDITNEVLLNETIKINGVTYTAELRERDIDDIIDELSKIKGSVNDTNLGDKTEFVQKICDIMLKQNSKIIKEKLGSLRY